MGSFLPNEPLAGEPRRGIARFPSSFHWALSNVCAQRNCRCCSKCFLVTRQSKKLNVCRRMFPVSAGPDRSPAQLIQPIDGPLEWLGRQGCGYIPLCVLAPDISQEPEDNNKNQDGRDATAAKFPRRRSRKQSAKRSFHIFLLAISGGRLWSPRPPPRKRRRGSE